MFSFYRSGYNRGFADGRDNRFFKPNFFLLVLNPIVLLPLCDATSLFKGYADGYRDGQFAFKSGLQNR